LTQSIQLITDLGQKSCAKVQLIDWVLKWQIKKDYILCPNLRKGGADLKKCGKIELL